MYVEIAKGGINYRQSGLEKALILWEMIHKVHVSNNSKHDGKDAVKQQEVEKIHTHFSNNLDKWPDAFIELKN
jgi:hypothetical protein